MHLLFLASLWSAALPVLAGALETSSWYSHERSPASSPPDAATIIDQLRPLLSAESTIFGQDDIRWEDVTERWQAAYQPSFSVVVEPAIEADVPVIVCSFCYLTSSTYLPWACALMCRICTG